MSGLDVEIVQHRPVIGHYLAKQEADDFSVDARHEKDAVLAVCDPTFHFRAFVEADRFADRERRVGVPESADSVYVSRTRLPNFRSGQDSIP